MAECNASRAGRTRRWQDFARWLERAIRRTRPDRRTSSVGEAIASGIVIDVAAFVDSGASNELDELARRAAEAGA
jgi:hypothetical protein